MRIGEVTTESYKEFLKIFGVKDTTALDNLFEKSSDANNLSEEERIANLVRLGYIEEGMYVGGGDTSWKKIVPVSDAVRNKLIEVVRRQTLANGDLKGYARDGDEIGALYKEFRKSIAPSERLSFTYTLSQIVREENQRIIDYVRANVPGWNFGQPIPSDVLKAAVSGDGYLDIKA